MLIFTIIAVAVDTSEKTDDFVKTGLSTSKIITEYFFGFVPHIWGLLFPLFVFIAVIFFTSSMAAKSEIISILASGVSFNRLLRPYFIGGIFLASIIWYANRYVIPKANVIRSDFETTYLDGPGDPATLEYTSSYYLQTDTNTFAGIKYYDTAMKRSSGFFLEKVHNGVVHYNMRADGMAWDTPTNKWKLNNVIIREINGLEENVTRIDDTIINLNMEPRDLRKDQYLKDKMTTPELKEFIRWQELRGVEGLNTLK